MIPGPLWHQLNHLAGPSSSSLHPIYNLHLDACELQLLIIRIFSHMPVAQNSQLGINLLARVGSWLGGQFVSMMSMQYQHCISMWEVFLLFFFWIRQRRGGGGPPPRGVREYISMVFKEQNISWTTVFSCKNIREKDTSRECSHCFAPKCISTFSFE